MLSLLVSKFHNIFWLREWFKVSGLKWGFLATAWPVIASSGVGFVVSKAAPKAIIPTISDKCNGAHCWHVVLWKIKGYAVKNWVLVHWRETRIMCWCWLPIGNQMTADVVIFQAILLLLYCTFFSTYQQYIAIIPDDIINWINVTWWPLHSKI